MADYIPLHGASLLEWARNFASRIAAAPADYGLKEEEVAAIVRVVDAYATAYAVASSLPTRTRASVATKNATRDAMLRLLRRYGQVIKASPTISESAKFALRLTLPSGRTRITAPATRPFVHVVGVQPLRHVLRFTSASEGDDSTGAGRPANAVGLQLFCHVGSEAPADPLDARFERFVSRRRHVVEFRREQIGATAFYYARWQTATGETGPWSAVARMSIAG